MNKTGFKDNNDFCLYLEKIKIEHNMEDYTEALLWYHENESDMDMEQLAKHLNPKILEFIKYEALQKNMLKEKNELVSLF